MSHSSKGIFLSAIIVVFLAGCSTSAHITRAVKKELWEQPEFQRAHLGVCIYDVAANNYLYNYQGDKYFVPASNVKIFTLYAGMKFLKDSLPGIHYKETADSFFIYPTGDPTLLHPDFDKQPVIEKLQHTHKKLVLVNDNWKEEALGSGWSWDDYNDSYQPERSSFPVYGNVIKWTQSTQKTPDAGSQDRTQTYIFSEPEVNWKLRFVEDTLNKTFFVKRKKDENYFEASEGKEPLKEQWVPFVTNGVSSAVELLKDTVASGISVVPRTKQVKSGTIFSQPADSVFKLMMLRSDNFFAEQTLLMVSNEKLGFMNDAAIIDTIMRTELKELPQQPVWVDGSGLSRYNLFTPEDFVWILNKMRMEFGLERLKTILPGAGEGTLLNYFPDDKGFIYAKTGTLSGQVALSGLLITNKNKLLIFSVLVNNHEGSATAVRRAVEKFISSVRKMH